MTLYQDLLNQLIFYFHIVTTDLKWSLLTLLCPQTNRNFPKFNYQFLHHPIATRLCFPSYLLTIFSPERKRSTETIRWVVEKPGNLLCAAECSTERKIASELAKSRLYCAPSPASPERSRGHHDASFFTVNRYRPSLWPEHAFPGAQKRPRARTIVNFYAKANYFTCCMLLWPQSSNSKCFFLRELQFFYFERKNWGIYR